MKKISKILITASFMLLFAGAFFSYGAKLDDAQKKIDTLETEKKNTENMIEELNGLKSDINEYVKKLDDNLLEIEDQIDTLNTDIDELEKEIKAAEADIDRADADLNATQVKKDEQYENMKLRIKYMYEQSDADMLDLIFGSGSFTQFLNRSEYVSGITQYDRSQMDEYEKTCQLYEEKKADLEEKLTQLQIKKDTVTALKNETEAKQDTVTKLISDKKEEIEGYENKIGTAKEQLEKYEAEIKKQEATIKAIEEEIARKEEEARRLAIAKGQAVKTVDLGDINFIWPCPSSTRITSYYGGREAPVEGASTEHKGIDIGASTGSDIVAAAEGEVIISTYSASAGNYVMLNHGGGIYTVYMHASKLCCSVGDSVKAGDVIAKVGSTGYSSGPHLHFGIRAGGQYINPLAYVSP